MGVKKWLPADVPMNSISLRDVHPKSLRAPYTEEQDSKLSRTLKAANSDATGIYINHVSDVSGSHQDVPDPSESM